MSFKILAEMQYSRVSGHSGTSVSWFRSKSMKAIGPFALQLETKSSEAIKSGDPDFWFEISVFDERAKTPVKTWFSHMNESVSTSQADVWHFGPIFYPSHELIRGLEVGDAISVEIGSRSRGQWSLQVQGRLVVKPLVGLLPLTEHLTWSLRDSPEEGVYTILTNDESVTTAHGNKHVTNVWFKTPPLPEDIVSRLNSVKLLTDPRHRGSITDKIQGIRSLFDLAVFENEDEEEISLGDNGGSLVALGQKIAGKLLNQGDDFVSRLKVGNVIGVRVRAQYSDYAMLHTIGTPKYRMSTMRAILVRGEGRIEDLYIGETEKPIPKDDEVLVNVEAFGLNRMDIMQRRGGYKVPAGASSILGVEFSGTIAEVGKTATQWKEGDEVLGLVGGGAYAEYVVAPSTHVWRKPSHLSWVDAAAIPENWLTAFQALTIPELKAGEDVLVHTGASGVGLAANQLSRFWKANKVITTASTSEKLDWLLSLPSGPTHTINYKTQDFAEEVKKITNGKGVDVIVDFPGQSHFVKNLDSLALDGRMTMLALLSGNEVSKLNLTPILYKRLRIQGSTLRSRSKEYQADLIQRFTSTVGAKITGEKGEGPLRTYIHAVYTFDRIQDAHREMESNGTAGKLIVTIP